MSRETEGRRAAAVTALGEESTAAAWDDFLAMCPRGQFQQTSAWARVKALEGWSATRECIDPDEPSLGGFQLLWKRMGPARVGYLSKGPVLREETESTTSAAVQAVVTVASRLRLAAVVVQAPDDSAITSETLVRHGFFQEPLASVIRATGIISLDGGDEGVVRRMSRTARQHWRTACRQGLSIGWGTREDLAVFFRLMCGSSSRQGENPNPPRVDLLEALWDAFPGRPKLAFAEHGGRRLAGLLMLPQRDQIILWKRGWSSEEPHLFASQFLMTECLVWASSAGYRWADVVSMSPDVATAVLAGEELTAEQSRGRDVFHLRLGARPKFLPPAHLFVANAALRGVSYAALRWRPVRRALERRVR